MFAHDPCKRRGENVQVYLLIRAFWYISQPVGLSYTDQDKVRIDDQQFLGETTPLCDQ
jgi:hypothetical protein